MRAKRTADAKPASEGDRDKSSTRKRAADDAASEHDALNQRATDALRVADVKRAEKAAKVSRATDERAEREEQAEMKRAAAVREEQAKAKRAAEKLSKAKAKPAGTPAVSAPESGGHAKHSRIAGATDASRLNSGNLSFRPTSFLP